jgi:hypothetical protein
MGAASTNRPRPARPARFSRRCVQCMSYVTPDSATAGEVERWFGGIPNYRYSFACQFCEDPTTADPAYWGY